MDPADDAGRKTFTLDDGREVGLRCLNPDDAERLYWFYGGLSEEDRRYLRVDVRDRNLVIDRVRNTDPKTTYRLIAEDQGEIVGEASLETAVEGWEAHLGEIRMQILPDYRGRGLGRQLARTIYLHAIERGLRRLIARVMRPQEIARRIFKRLGFTEEALLPDHVEDQTGHPQDLVVMYLDIEDLKRELSQEYTFTDWRRHR